MTSLIPRDTRIFAILAPFLHLGCGQSETMNPPGALDPQVPPADATAMAEWLDAWTREGWEEEWVCETEPTAKTDGTRSIHVHNDADGKNRVCNNQRLAAAEVATDTEVPVGSASVKFVGDRIYVDVKVAEKSDGGQGWYWYAPGGSPEGLGIGSCTGCHGAAGADADHPGLGDYVYFQVR